MCCLPPFLLVLPTIWKQLNSRVFNLFQNVRILSNSTSTVLENRDLRTDVQTLRRALKSPCERAVSSRKVAPRPTSTDNVLCVFRGTHAAAVVHSNGRVSTRKAVEMHLV